MNSIFIFAENSFDLIAVALLIIGTLRMIPVYFINRKNPKGVFKIVREGMAKTIILSLEFLIIADIIRSVANVPTLQGVTILGIIILIRSFLSLELQMEIDGKLPWRKNGK